ncbi:MAG TPA: 50S ribosomal protein L17 [Flavobacteriales bacterium]|nr:50S ribosomal protein L17 [Flavobacteriales bacterium]
MRHGKKFNHLGRKTAHRKAMLTNMSCSLIEHKRITTTVAKAKALKKYFEPLVNRSKDDSTHNRRVCFRYLASKDAVTELFREVGPKVANRDGGYTRIIRTGNRLGDNAEMCMIELVDFNEIYNKNEKKKTRRSRRGGASTVSKTENAPAADVAADAPANVAADAPADVAADVAADADDADVAADAPAADVAADAPADVAADDADDADVAVDAPADVAADDSASEDDTESSNDDTETDSSEEKKED